MQLFVNLSDKEKADIERIGVVRQYPRGSVIIKEGEVGTSIFLIKSGLIEVRKQLDKEKYKQLKNLWSGDFFGEMSFLSPAPRSASVLAVEDTEILEISREAFDRFTEQDPQTGMKVYRNMAQELTARLRKGNEELRRAFLWAIEEMIS